MQLLPINLVDVLIALALIFFAWEAWRVGFWIILTDFLSFVITLVSALLFYPRFSTVLKTVFSLGKSLSNAISFLIIAVIVEAILGYLFVILVRKIPGKLRNFRFSKPLSIILSIGEVLVISSFFLTLIMSLPISPSVKLSIDKSLAGKYLLGATSRLETRLADIFGGAFEESLTHLVVNEESKESILLEIEIVDLENDAESEGELFDLVNSEREGAGVPKLVWNTDVVPVARGYAKDMWERKYFGHYSPEGENVVDRLQKAGLGYTSVGENLALAPTVGVAHEGLMNSPGHRANILSPDFSKIGIGVFDNGYYGKIFVQVFTD